MLSNEEYSKFIDDLYALSDASIDSKTEEQLSEIAKASREKIASFAARFAGDAAIDKEVDPEGWISSTLFHIQQYEGLFARPTEFPSDTEVYSDALRHVAYEIEQHAKCIADQI